MSEHVGGQVVGSGSLSYDLRRWVSRVREAGLLKEVRGAHWDLEIGGITDLNAKRNKWSLLFDEIPGYPEGYRILTGTMLDARRVSHTFGLQECRTDLELVEAFREQLKSQGGETAARGDDSYGEVPVSVPGLGSKNTPYEVGEAPLFENRFEGDEVDILRLPVPKWHEQDSDRYIGTLDAVITRDPESDWVNVGAYRNMVYDNRTLCVFINASHHGRAHLQKHQERGERAPIAISFGHHPLISALGGMEIPEGMSEYDYAGMLRSEPYPVVRGPVTGLPIPADSEIAIEGYVSNDLVDEGPYGEFLGYYAGGSMKTPTIEVRALYHRNAPILLGTNAGIPPYDYSYFRCPVRAAMIWNGLEKAGVPNVAGVWCHEAGYSRAINIVAIKQAYKGHAQQAGFVASQIQGGVFGGKYVIVVDEDIDPTDTNQVLWALASRTDPVHSFEFIKNSWGMALDPMVEREEGQGLNELSMSRAVVNACKPIERLNKDEFPRTVEVRPDLREKLLREWADVLGEDGRP